MQWQYVLKKKKSKTCRFTFLINRFEFLWRTLNLLHWKQKILWRNHDFINKTKQPWKKLRLKLSDSWLKLSEYDQWKLKLNLTRPPRLFQWPPRLFQRPSWLFLRPPRPLGFSSRETQPRVVGIALHAHLCMWLTAGSHSVGANLRSNAGSILWYLIPAPNMNSYSLCE